GLIRLKNYYYAFALTDFFVFLSCAEKNTVGNLYYFIELKSNKITTCLELILSCSRFETY
ncbi:hypothetical protein, partial [Acinetobacter sp. 226]|uniref:hypothetical protein n=1 Tax=Acinetobacter sp. 226 TaxID=3114699 RepID=UPI003A8B841D